MVSRLYNDPKHELVLDKKYKLARIEAAWKALRDFLYSPRGANISRALPVAKVEKLVIALADRPIGVVHPFYEGRDESTKKLFGNEAEIFEAEGDEGYKLFEEVLEKIKEKI